MRVVKKQMKKAVGIILLTIVCIVLINIFSNHVMVNGLGSLFTISMYEDIQEANTGMINILRWCGIAFTIMACYANLEYNCEMYKLEKKYRKEVGI